MSSKALLGPLAVVLSFSTPVLAQQQSDPEAPAEKPVATDNSATASVSTANAAPAERGTVMLGLRLGYGIPMGKAAGGADGGNLSDGISGQIPIQLDLGYMVTPNLMLGLYGQYSFGMLGKQVSDSCDANQVDCSASGIRVGVQGQYHFSPSEAINPWLGLGIGYEWNTISMSSNGVSADSKYSGFEFATLQGGADFRVLPNLGVGPFVSFSLGEFSSASALGRDVDIQEKAIHEWLTLGVRGAFYL